MPGREPVPIRLAWPEDPRPKQDVGPPFRRLNGGWLGLDFVNTVPGWASNPERRDGRDWEDRVLGERIEAYDDLVRWSRLEDVIDDDTAAALERSAIYAPDEAAAVAERARGLRGAVYRLYRAALEGWASLSEDLEAIDAELRRLRHGEVLVPAEIGLTLAWRSDAAELQSLLWPPLRSALSLLTRPELLVRVRRCGGPGCGWLFVDTGPGRSRRWCDARDCGNVAKVRAYRHRQQRRRR